MLEVRNIFLCVINSWTKSKWSLVLLLSNDWLATLCGFSTNWTGNTIGITKLHFWPYFSFLKTGTWTSRKPNSSQTLNRHRCCVLESSSSVLLFYKHWYIFFFILCMYLCVCFVILSYHLTTSYHHNHRKIKNYQDAAHSHLNEVNRDPPCTCFQVKLSCFSQSSNLSYLLFGGL